MKFHDTISIYRAGIKVPSVEVRWQNLHVECNVVVGDRGLPTVMNSYRTFIEVILLNSLQGLPSMSTRVLGQSAFITKIAILQLASHLSAPKNLSAEPAIQKQPASEYIGSISIRESACTGSADLGEAAEGRPAEIHHSGWHHRYSSSKQDLPAARASRVWEVYPAQSFGWQAERSRLEGCFLHH